jgi:hypothetical protein
MERAGDGRSVRHEVDLPDPAGMGAEAGRRAVARLGGRKIDSRTAATIFENRTAMSLLGPLIGAISGPAVARGVSFLKDKLGERLFAPGIDLIEDPFRPRGLGSALFDDEGVVKTERKLIDDGVLTTWLLNTASAKQLGLETTGHASRGLAGRRGVDGGAASGAGDARLRRADARGGRGAAGHLHVRAVAEREHRRLVGRRFGLLVRERRVAYPVTEITGGREPDRHLRAARAGVGSGVPELVERAVAADRRRGDRGQVTDAELILDAALEAGELALRLRPAGADGRVQGRQLAGQRRGPRARRPADATAARGAAGLWLAVGGDGGRHPAAVQA